MSLFDIFTPRAAASVPKGATPSSGDDSEIAGDSSPTIRSPESSRVGAGRGSDGLTTSPLARQGIQVRKMRGVKRARVSQETVNTTTSVKDEPEPDDDSASNRATVSDSGNDNVVQASVAASAVATPVQTAAQTPKRKRGKPPKAAAKDTARDIDNDAAKLAKSNKPASPRRSARIFDLEVKKTALEAEAAKRAKKEARSTTTAKKTKPAAGNTKRTPKEWEVESIVGSYIDPRTQEKKFKIKWKGYSSDRNTWEPEENLVGCDEAVKEYEARQKASVQKKKKRGGRTKV